MTTWTGTSYLPICPAVIEVRKAVNWNMCTNSPQHVIAGCICPVVCRFGELFKANPVAVSLVDTRKLKEELPIQFPEQRPPAYVAGGDTDCIVDVTAVQVLTFADWSTMHCHHVVCLACICIGVHPVNFQLTLNTGVGLRRLGRKPAEQEKVGMGDCVASVC